MDLSQQLLFLLSAIGAINGFILGIYLIIKQPVTLKHRVLGLLVLMVSLRVTKSVFFYFNPDIAKQFLQLGLTACFFIGPLCLLYIVSSNGVFDKLISTRNLHLGALVSLCAGFGMLYPYHNHSELWTLVVSIIYYQWLAYMLLSSFVMARIWNRSTDKSTLLRDNYTEISVFIGCWVLWAAYFFSRYTSYIAGALSFTFLFYVTLAVVLWGKKSDKSASKVTYQNNKIDDARASNIMEELNRLMKEDLLYCNANLKLPEVAKMLGITPQMLSQILNDNMQVSFSTYINQLRIQQASEILQSSKPMKMEVIAETCGFNSQSTFYSAFKAIKQTTPAKYRQQFFAAG